MAADNCLKMYHDTRLAEEKPVEIPAAPRDIGLLVHAYREAFLKGEDPQTALIAQPHTEHRKEGWDIFLNWKRNFTVPEEDWLFVEREGHAKIEGVPDLVGYDDFVYREGEYHVIVDEKTGWGTDIAPSYAFQLHLAMLRYEQEYPGIKLKAEIDFSRRGIRKRLTQKNGYNGEEELVWNDSLREATIDRVKAIFARIQAANKANAWPATPGSHCTFCPVIAQCAKGRRAQAAGLVVADEQSAKEAILEVALMEEALSVIKAALRPYVDAHGPVSSGDGKYDYEASFSGGKETESIKDVKSVLDLVGHDLPKGVIKLDLKLKGAASLLSNEKVQAFIERKPSGPKFTVKKRSAKDDE